MLIIGSLLVFCLAVLLTVPRFLNIKKYKPEIEKKVSEASGRPFRIDGDLKLFLFPVTGVSLSGLHLGNPPGFKEEDFITVKSLEVRLKLLPLLFKKIQIVRFIMEEPRIVLEKGKDGVGNWKNSGKRREEKVFRPGAAKEKPAGKEAGYGLPVKSLVIGDLKIEHGSLVWVDRAAGNHYEIKNLSVRLENISLNQPVHLSAAARFNGAPLSLAGDLGPVGRSPGGKPIPLDFSLKAANYLRIDLKGRVLNATEDPQFILDIGIRPFSAKKLFSILGWSFPLKTADPEALTRLSFKARVKADRQSASVQEAVFMLDDSKLAFSSDIEDFSRPKISLNMTLDQIDADRYLPPPDKKKKERNKTGPSPEKSKDYASLRKLVLKATVKAGKVKVKKARFQDLLVKARAQNGIFKLNPVSLKLYQGNLSAKGIIDLHRNIPRSSFELQADGLQINPMLKDMLEKDFIEGTARARLSLRMEGREARQMKQTLNGRGEVLFKNGALKGLNLTRMIRNVRAAFNRPEESGPAPRTAFSTLYSLFSISNGVVETSNTYLQSPLIRVTASGQASLVDETLNFRVEPNVAAVKHPGVLVPVLIKGTFSNPSFKPDLKGIIKQRIEEKLPAAIKELHKIIQEREKGQNISEPLEEKTKSIIENLFK